jgi:hypothetical protein
MKSMEFALWETPHTRDAYGHVKSTTSPDQSTPMETACPSYLHTRLIEETSFDKRRLRTYQTLQRFYRKFSETSGGNGIGANLELVVLVVGDDTPQPARRDSLQQMGWIAAPGQNS